MLQLTAKIQGRTQEDNREVYLQFIYRIFTTVRKSACAAHEYGGECKVETVRCLSGRDVNADVNARDESKVSKVQNHKNWKSGKLGLPLARTK